MKKLFVLFTLFILFTLFSGLVPGIGNATSTVKIFDRSGVPQGLEIVDGRLVITSSTVPQPTKFETDIIQRDTVTLSGSESTVTLNGSTTSVIIQKITGEVTMYINSSSNLAEISEITTDEYSSVILGVSNYDTSLIFTGTGTVEVEQRRRPSSLYR